MRASDIQEEVLGIPVCFNRPYSANRQGIRPCRAMCVCVRVHAAWHSLQRFAGPDTVTLKLSDVTSLTSACTHTQTHTHTNALIGSSDSPTLTRGAYQQDAIMHDMN